MTDTQTVLYTARVRTTGSRNGGTSQSSDGNLSIRHAVPGGAGVGTNPEQLLAAGWSACFAGALSIAARERRRTITQEIVIDAEVELLRSVDGYFLRARLAVRIPGMEDEFAQELIEAAHRICPYSKATRGNIDVLLTWLSDRSGPLPVSASERVVQPRTSGL